MKRGLTPGLMTPDSIYDIDLVTATVTGCELATKLITEKLFVDKYFATPVPDPSTLVLAFINSAFMLRLRGS